MLWIPAYAANALVRHLADRPAHARRVARDVWLAYGAAPGPAAQIARLSASPAASPATR